MKLWGTTLSIAARDLFIDFVWSRTSQHRNCCCRALGKIFALRTLKGTPLGRYLESQSGRPLLPGCLRLPANVQSRHYKASGGQDASDDSRGIHNEASGNEPAASPTMQTRHSGVVAEESTQPQGEQRVVADEARRERRVRSSRRCRRSRQRSVPDGRTGVGGIDGGMSPRRGAEDWASARRRAPARKKAAKSRYPRLQRDYRARSYFLRSRRGCMARLQLQRSKGELDFVRFPISMRCFIRP